MNKRAFLPSLAHHQQTAYPQEGSSAAPDPGTSSYPPASRPLPHSMHSGENLTRPLSSVPLYQDARARGDPESLEAAVVRAYPGADLPPGALVLKGCGVRFADSKVALKTNSTKVRYVSEGQSPCMSRVNLFFDSIQ